MRVIAGLAAALIGLAAGGAHDLRAPSFNYADIDRFAEAVAEIQGGAEPEAAFQRYLDGAGPGLFGWAQRYDVPASSYARAFQRYPEYMTYLGALRPALEARETEIAGDLTRLRDLVADALGRRTLSSLPTYYFVTPMGGGGSAEPIANMIGVDYYGRNDGAPLNEFDDEGLFPEGSRPLQSLDAMRPAASHEMVHWYQRLTLGFDRYVAIYREPGADTLLARAVREGGADFIARLASGASTPDQLAFGDAHEEALWRSFRGHIEELTDDNPGWFSGRHPDHPNAAWQMGYYVGMRMCEAFYEAAEDRNEALRAILAAQTTDDYRAIMAAYDARWATAEAE